MSNIPYLTSLKALLGETLTTYSYSFYYRVSKANGEKPFKRVQSVQLNQITLDTELTYVTPMDRKRLKNQLPNNLIKNNHLHRYLKACSLALRPDSLHRDLSDEIKGAHKYNPDKSEKILKALADENYKIAEYALSTLYLDSDNKRALEYLRSCAKKDLKEAQFSLYGIYKHGSLSQKPDEQKAFRYLQKAAEQGQIEALYTIHTVFKSGKLGQNRDEKKAFYYLEKAAEHGLKEAQYALYQAYRYGMLGQAKNEEKAFDLLYKAASNGDRDAQFELSQVYNNGTLGKPSNPEIALLYLKKAADQDLPIAESLLAIEYYRYSNFNGALTYLQKAADHGEKTAQYNLAISYLHGTMNQAQNQELALKYCQLAADQNLPNAIDLLKELQKKPLSIDVSQPIPEPQVETGSVSKKIIEVEEILEDAADDVSEDSSAKRRHEASADSAPKRQKISIDINKFRPNNSENTEFFED